MIRQGLLWFSFVKIGWSIKCLPLPFEGLVAARTESTLLTLGSCASSAGVMRSGILGAGRDVETARFAAEAMEDKIDMLRLVREKGVLMIRRMNK
jgi:hypothetical protein